ncbi:hypothetical protein G0Q06_12040 [Puniceicoccales bacterium CK1056]|uniref:endo-1,4-beta-xylanase n=1 Tax=Oceanipulchritudo coccoides TaxID=2706888 RepID=A0A6B2M4A9_9BACT|nr:endo-1,4-beta-xylanase [Oceanipulchritudo coccoides]NDV63186.1 hypothetical protein [Oceanipulchritudo coccoides]
MTFKRCPETLLILRGFVSIILVSFSVLQVRAAPLTTEEIVQIETDLGITLSTAEKNDLAQIAKPDSPFPQWRIDAEARIEANRKAKLDVQVVDELGFPVQGAEVAVRLKKNAFKFGGVVQAQDLTDADGDLSSAGSTTADWERLVKGLFNALGTANNFKPKLAGLHEYLPGFLDWADANSLDVRGHLLIWPGSQGIEEMDTPGSIIGEDYGKHLSQGWPESLNSIPGYEGVVSYDVQQAVLTFKDSTRTQADKDAVEAVVDAEIGQWAGLWDVYEWDVINETLNNRLLMEIMGYDQMAEWFKIADANKVNPDCKLLINDYKIISAPEESGAPNFLKYSIRRDTYKSRIDQILADGGPLDRIGFQNRYTTGVPDPVTTYSRLEEWGNAYGFEMVGTEFEIVDRPLDNWYPYDFTELERAQITEETLTAYFSHPLATGLNAWTFMDNGDEQEKALAYYDGTVKLNGLVWYYLHRIRYNTDESFLADATGQGTVRGFKGDYEITVTHDGETQVFDYSLQGDDVLVLTVNSTISSAVVVEKWDFTGNSLIGINGTPTSFFENSNIAVTNTDQTGGAFDNTFTVNRSSGFSGNIFDTPLGINAGNTDTVTLQFTLSAWDLSNTALNNNSSGSSFGIRLRNDSAQNIMFLQVRAYKDSGGTEYLRLQGSYYDGSNAGQLIQGGYAASGLTGSSAITVGLTFNLDAETYTFWMGDPVTDDGSGWNDRFVSYTGSAPGISAQTISQFSWALFPFEGSGDMTGDFIELDEVVFSTAALNTFNFDLTDIQVSGGNLIIDFTGTAGTAWTVLGSTDLSDFTDVTADSTIVESPDGTYNVTVPMIGDRYFVRFGSP